MNFTSFTELGNEVLFRLNSEPLINVNVNAAGGSSHLMIRRRKGEEPSVTIHSLPRAVNDLSEILFRLTFATFTRLKPASRENVL